MFRFSLCANRTSVYTVDVCKQLLFTEKEAFTLSTPMSMLSDMPIIVTLVISGEVAIVTSESHFAE